MKLPYSKFALIEALVSVSKKVPDKKMEETFKEIEKELDDKLPSNTISVNSLVAKHNNISIETLTNSPNLQALQSQYQEFLYISVANKIQEKLKITEKEAWAIITVKLNLLD
jgi:hypothetical protein